MDRPIYLDYNATTPVDPAVADTMAPFLREFFGNPSSNHYYGSQTRLAIEAARKQVSDLLGAFPYEIVFTSGGTESNNLAIIGAAHARRHLGNHIITTSVEHPAVLEVCRYLEMEGFEIGILPVNEYGMVDPSELLRLIRPDTILISIMHANNEVGTIQPVADIGKIAREKGIWMHCDAAQSVGKIPVNVNDLNVDLLSVAGHKLYAPKGIGALYIRQGIRLDKIIHGADHEQNRRPGTENVLEIAGIGKACELVMQNGTEHAVHLKKMRDLLEQLILERFPGAVVHGHPEKRLPNTLSIGFPGIEANTLLSSVEGVAASAGAACHADQVTISGVLRAMHVPIDVAMGTIRLSTGRYTTEKEIREAARLITESVIALSPNSTRESQRILSGAIKLTQFTHGLGCACKLRPQDLEKVVKELKILKNPDILVGPETADDAAVFRISNDIALVETVDFFTPVVDDPYLFGAIAAANALSDIYAMGAKPLFALNIVGFPVKRLDLQVLRDILRGAQDKAAEAGISVLGGHTIEDTEPKYGMVVTGSVHPDKIWTNSGAREGDALILTKPLGTGIYSTALKQGLLSDNQADIVYRLMSTLNKNAAETLHSFTIHACTDVTGFGLIGHLLEMTRGSQEDAELQAANIPYLSDVFQLIGSGVVPGGTRNNLAYVNDWVSWPGNYDEIQKLAICDAQTSGGLLAALPADEAAEAVSALHRNGIAEAVIIGRIRRKGNGRINFVN
ncbi:MAG: selenide, water dikinase SelD [Bacteroidia bacterium]|nr:selenide, water dikinase SelD [Bacteroidia bacterium]